MIAIGIGCRKGCEAKALVGLIRRALQCAALMDHQATLFTLIDKQNELGIAAAARELHFPLVFLSRDMLHQASSRVATRSPRVMELFGVPSIAEAAALAGAGQNSILLVPRMSEAGATCAIAGTPTA